jgi:hypothetical protein
MDLEIGCQGVEWIHLAQDDVQWLVLVNTVFIKGGEFLGWVTQILEKDAPS